MKFFTKVTTDQEATLLGSLGIVLFSTHHQTCNFNQCYFLNFFQKSDQFFILRKVDISKIYGKGTKNWQILPEYILIS